MTDEWINAKDRLPETSDKVLIWFTYCKDGDDTQDYSTYAIASYSKRLKGWVNVAFCDSSISYTRMQYWMPLPKPPGSTEKEY